MANIASGSVGPDAPAQVEKIFADHGVDAHVCAPEKDDLTNCLRAAVDAAPDLLVILAGDGTARAAAELCGPTGPVLAPLAGGTMNMLPHAIYGERPWQDALTIALAQGEERMLSGGEVEGHKFLVAGIFGSPALWAPAREAARHGKTKLAFLRARRAAKRAFSGRLRYMLDQGPREKAEALTIMCPLASRALSEDEPVLECAALDLSGAMDAFRLGFHALTGDWRDDPNVVVETCRVARIWAADGIPAILDGESVRLKSLTEVTYRPDLVRVLAIPKDL
ncbi:diacylglycerol kinase family protein [Phenylobacterium sp. J367]|uniref:diacylglycerol/lipid kinase family protein n=1 Tax=Phenylobacterium sp. J367 TaxID=2898435 RepID=UPI002150C910|nr:diacylglycerol kinase family protein [Phenylobacterium sp. J367]MCR5877787.1 diacylglycerol kinase family lipid kinase [Phenylobacterium sp. J367]